jgi:DNA-directed RNA polymerase specialized sigma24 family protein
MKNRILTPRSWRKTEGRPLDLAIDRLPILLREALVLHIVEGLPYADIAEITGASVDALHVRAHRAKALLRKQLGSVVDTFWVERT